MGRYITGFTPLSFAINFQTNINLRFTHMPVPSCRSLSLSVMLSILVLLFLRLRLQSMPSHPFSHEALYFYYFVRNVAINASKTRRKRDRKSVLSPPLQTPDAGYSDSNNFTGRILFRRWLDALLFCWEMLSSLCLRN